MPGALLGPFGRYELGSEAVTMGRSSTNTIVIPDSQVSGRHLQIIPQGADYILVDVGSSNGTVLNGMPLRPQTPQALRNGDVIIIGTTRLTMELPQGTFQAAAPTFQAAPPPTIQGVPAQPGFLPSEQMGFPQGPAAPNFGPPAQPGMPPADPFGGGYAGAPPAQPGYYPGGFMPPGQPGMYQGAPDAGFAPPPTRRRRRVGLLIGAVLAVLVILGGSGVAIFLLTHRTPPGPTIPNATTQVVTPFYNNLKSQNYQAATKLFTAEYLEQHGGGDQFISVIFQPIDQIRGTVTAFHIASVKPVNGSATNEVAMVNVTRDPAKGTFDPDMLVLVYQKGKWLISQWQPGQRQASG